MPRYRLSQPEPLVSPDWGASAVAFDRRTGSTHLVSSLAAALLAELRDCASGREPPDLAASLAATIGADGTEEIDDLVRDALIDLEKTGLIARLDAD